MQEFIGSLTSFDYICLGVLLFSMIMGLVKGFIKEIAGVISLLLSVIIAKASSLPITMKLYEFFNIREIILDKLENTISEVYVNQVNTSIDGLKAGLETVLSKFSFIGDYVSKAVIEDFGVYEVLSKQGDNFVSELSLKLLSHLEPIVLYVLSTVLFLILCVVIGIILKIVMGSLSSIIKKIPLIGGMNSLLGLCIGGIKGVCFVVLITFTAFLGVSIFTNIDGWIANAILNSKVFELVSTFKYLIT